MGFIHCPKCRRDTDIYHNYAKFSRSLGEPYVQCDQCRVFIRLDFQNEWDLMTIGQKLVYVLWLSYPILVFGFIAGAIMHSFLKEASVIAGVIAALARLYIFHLQVAESKERLTSSHYRRELAGLGFLRYEQEIKQGISHYVYMAIPVLIIVVLYVSFALDFH